MKESMLVLVICVVSALGLNHPVAAQAHGDAPGQGDAAASTEQARMHFNVAQRFYDMGHFAEAAREFQAAYDISHLAPLQYNLYLAYRDGGDDVRAAAALRNYLASMEDNSQRAQLAARLEVLDQRIAAAASRTAGAANAGPDRQAAQAPPEGGTSSADAAHADSAEPGHANEAEDDHGSVVMTPGSGGGEPGAPAEVRAGGSSRLGPVVTMGAGGALLVGALVTGLMTHSRKSRVDELCRTPSNCTGDFESVVSSGRRLGITTDILWITGGLTAGAGLLWLMLGRGPEDSDTSAGIACDSSGCMASMQGAF